MADKRTLPRLYPILDTASLDKRGCADWSMVAQAMLGGGAQILQFRHKSDWTRDVFAAASAVAKACGDARAQFIVNDRADMAKLLGAGLHVGQEDLSPADCRLVIGDAPLLGFSTHNLDQLTLAVQEPLDYLAFGPVFSTQSKTNPDPVAGLELLSEARAFVSKPLVAIGGVTRHNVRAVFQGGANCVAVIGDLLPDTLDGASIRERMQQWQRSVAM